MKTTNPKDFIELLEVFSIALTHELLDKNEVIKWADAIILGDTEPDYFIIELSLSGQKSNNDIVSFLNQYIGHEKPQVSTRVILGFLYRQYLNGHITLKKLVNTVDWIIYETDITDEEKGFMYGLKENYLCAEEGIYGTIKDIEEETLRFLEIYKEFQFDNFKNWKTIDSTINIKVKILSEEIRKEREEVKKIQTGQRKRKWWKFW